MNDGNEVAFTIYEGTITPKESGNYTKFDLCDVKFTGHLGLAVEYFLYQGGYYTNYIPSTNETIGIRFLLEAQELEWVGSNVYHNYIFSPITTKEVRYIDMVSSTPDQWAMYIDIDDLHLTPSEDCVDKSSWVKGKNYYVKLKIVLSPKLDRYVTFTITKSSIYTNNVNSPSEYDDVDVYVTFKGVE